MHTWPRCTSGTAASAAGAMGAAMHQQLSGARPAAMAHWFGPPHNGQRDGGGGQGFSVDMEPLAGALPASVKRWLMG